MRANETTTGATRATTVRVPARPRARPTAPPAALDVRVVTSVDELAGLADRWQRLLLASPTATAFASPAWVLTWYRHVEAHRPIHAVTVWRGGELVGLAPFARTRLGGPRSGLTLLVSAGTEHGDHGDPLLGPDPLPVARVVADHLAGLARHDNTVVNLRRLRDDDALLALLEARDDVACVPMGRRAENAIVRFADMDDPDAVLARLARRSELPRNRRRLARDHGEVAFTDHLTGADVDVALDHMRDFLARRWAPGEGPRLFASPGRAAFTRAVTAALVDDGLGRVSALTAGGRTVAVTVDHRVGDREVGDATSFDPDFRTYAAGLVHLHEVVAGARADGVAELDMRAGDFRYKDDWATTTQVTRSIAVAAPGARGRAQLAGRRAAMSRRARRIAHQERRAQPTTATSGAPRSR